ncbi:hypothetical protein EON64_18760, partial [archaeon]
MLRETSAHPLYREVRLPHTLSEDLLGGAEGAGHTVLQDILFISLFIPPSPPLFPKLASYSASSNNSTSPHSSFPTLSKSEREEEGESRKE